MCRAFQPFTMQGIYFSLCASTQIKTYPFHLCLLQSHHIPREKNSKFAACKKKVQKILAYIGSIHYLCCKKEEPACWRGKLEEKPGQAQAGYQSSQLRCKL